MKKGAKWNTIEVKKKILNTGYTATREPDKNKNNKSKKETIPSIPATSGSSEWVNFMVSFTLS